jgi:excisionase family DNA binding protein
MQADQIEVKHEEQPPIIILLTLPQVAQALNMSLRFVNTLVLSGQIRSIKFGRLRRVWLSDLLAFIERQAELS